VRVLLNTYRGSLGGPGCFVAAPERVELQVVACFSPTFRRHLYHFVGMCGLKKPGKVLQPPSHFFSSFVAIVGELGRLTDPTVDSWAVSVPEWSVLLEQRRCGGQRTSEFERRFLGQAAPEALGLRYFQGIFLVLFPNSKRIPETRMHMLFLAECRLLPTRQQDTALVRRRYMRSIKSWDDNFAGYKGPLWEDPGRRINWLVFARRPLRRLLKGGE
jgi:hypothetical protein